MINVTNNNEFTSLLSRVVKFSFFFAILLYLSNCSSNTDPVTGEKVIINPDPKAKAREYADKGGGLFGDISKKGSANTFEFGTSNVLWRATLKTLEFLPLQNADYSGGVIVYDWYSDNNSNDQIKVTVRFLSNEVRSDSIQITSHKKTCINEKCSVTKLNNNFSAEIKDTILTAARALKIEDAKKEVK
jgi:hypothetical protein